MNQLTLTRQNCVSLSFLVCLCFADFVHSYVVSHRGVLPQARLTEAEWNSYNYREPEGPGTYAFGYDIDDSQTGNTQFRQEERLSNGSVIGSYGYVEPDGNVHTVRYIADELGYRVTIENSRDNKGPPKAMPYPAIRPSYNVRPQQTFDTTDYRNKVIYNNRPVAVVPGNHILPSVVAPIGLTPSPNFELPVKDYNRDFASRSPFGFQNDFNDVNPYSVGNSDFFNNAYYVHRQ